MQIVKETVSSEDKFESEITIYTPVVTILKLKIEHGAAWNPRIKVKSTSNYNPKHTLKLKDVSNHLSLAASTSHNLASDIITPHILHYMLTI